jgi:hypothetical protein
MKQLFFIIACFFSLQCLAQSNIPPITNAPSNTPLNLTTDDQWFKDRRVNYYWDESYIINGRRVLGTPFLYHTWEKGTVTTADGRQYAGYRLKYDAYHQTVYFNNGADSLEIDEEIKEFRLSVVYPDTITTSVFVNANQYKKEKKNFYYEILLDSKIGQVLKYNKKIVSEANKNIPLYEGKKFFELECTYFYYNKATNQITQIKANGSNIAAILDGDDTMTAELKNYDFSLEEQLIAFFMKYFELKKLK